jgi:hypothetical protein
VLLFNVKSMNKWSDKSFGDLLEVLHMAIPNGKELPKNFCEAKKLISKFGVRYENIDVCPNNRQLYRKEKRMMMFAQLVRLQGGRIRNPSLY